MNCPWHSDVMVGTFALQQEGSRFDSQVRGPFWVEVACSSPRLATLASSYSPKTCSPGCLATIWSYVCVYSTSNYLHYLASEQTVKNNIIQYIRQPPFFSHIKVANSLAGALASLAGHAVEPVSEVVDLIMEGFISVGPGVTELLVGFLFVRLKPGQFDL